jgi:hypothetical protein
MHLLSMFSLIYSYVLVVRLQLFKRRKKEAEDKEYQMQKKAAMMIANVYHKHKKWCRFLKVAEKIRKELFRHR